MKKQKKQLMIMSVALIFAIVVLVFVFKLPDEEEAAEGQSYQVTNLDKEAINKLSFTNESGMYNFIRQDETWIYETDRELNMDEDVIERMIGKVAALTSENRIEQVEDTAQYGLDEPEAVILISDGTTSYTIFVGDYNELTETYYLCLESDKTTVYTSDSYTTSDFIEKGIDDLITKEEETSAET